MKNIINNKILASIVIVLALVFVAGIAGAPAAHAQYVNYPTGYTYQSYPTSYTYQQYGGTYAYTAPNYCSNHYCGVTYTQPVYAPVYVSCYPTSSSVNTGNTATWTSSVSGGNGVYSYSWSGTDGLIGSSASVAMPYYSSGIKTASVTVYSNGQSQTAYCSGSVNVYNNYPTTYYPPTTYYSPLQISCMANTTSAPTGSTVTWSANVSGGNGIYNYTWSGSDGITGYAQSISTAYNTLGQKLASVTVYSNGQTLTQSCNNTVSVGGYQNGYQNGYQTGYAVPTVISSNLSNNNSGLDIGCYADPATASISQPITWNVEVTGGNAPYTYSWTGSDGLTGSQSSVVKYYDNSGSKNAIVSVTSANGLTGTKACTNAVTVRSAGNYYAPASAAPVQQAQPAATPTNVLPAAALFSLGNIPWGWVAVLIILVLFGTVVYLLFNRQKI
jgi:hypothetical protein